MIVVDCSYTMAMVMPDEQRPASMMRTLEARLFVPPIWPFEVANVLRNSVRRQRLRDDQVNAVCADLDRYELEIVALTDASVRGRYQPSLAHDLMAYDAAYLELALQRRCTLATLDQRLAQAALRVGVPVID